MKKLVIILVVMLTWTAEGVEEKNEVEPRGKGVKFALISHFLYVVATKVIFLKIIYAGLFFALIYKGWNFVLWFIHYLKKKEHHVYIDDHHYEHDDFEHGHFDHGHFDHGHFNHGDSDHYGSFDNQPYSYDKHGYGSDYKKRIYDADGSYSVKS
ncbi:unnamed protein product [Arctia plantaginis]|uniref:Uncharacterized protein n=1 Tax=Arctia plantaginis TaxID=874455 RepID=A0A8S1A7S1_ARCPL|nr:unnamed protein product [Arctia plantaginis]